MKTKQNDKQDGGFRDCSLLKIKLAGAKKRPYVQYCNLEK